MSSFLAPFAYPMGSMGLVIFTYIYHKKSTIHVGVYTSPMDGMGMGKSSRPWTHRLRSSEARGCSVGCLVGCCGGKARASSSSRTGDFTSSRHFGGWHWDVPVGETQHRVERLMMIFWRRKQKEFLRFFCADNGIDWRGEKWWSILLAKTKNVTVLNSFLLLFW